MKGVLDTNVIVSGVLKEGNPPDAILRAWRGGAFQLVASAPLLEELIRVLGYPKIARRLGWSLAQQVEFVMALRESAVVVEPRQEIQAVPGDPSDNRIIEAVVEAEADYIVSGDHHLLALGSHAGIPIVAPARFAAILATDAPPM